MGTAKLEVHEKGYFLGLMFLEERPPLRDLMVRESAGVSDQRLRWIAITSLKNIRLFYCL